MNFKLLFQNNEIISTYFSFIEITVSTGKKIKFTGRFRRDLETDNWHYYELPNRSLLHFRKEHMVLVKSTKI